MDIWATRVCGIGDEAAPDLASQLEIHRSLGLSGVELRTVGGQGLHELTDGQLDDLRRQVEASGLRVPVLDTPIGNWSTTVATDLTAELSILTRTAAVADALGCRWLRVMSYPNDGRPTDDWAAESLRRMRLLTEEAERLGVVLLHENCQGWAGASAANTLRMLEHVDNPHLRLIFDVGNGLAYGYQAEEFLAEVLPWVEHVHLKNGYRDPSGEARFTLPDEGELDLAACVRTLEGAGYRGWYSLEPHVAHIPHLDVRGDAAELERSYRAYAVRLRETTLGTASGWGRSDLDWLIEFMAVDSVSPLEGGPRRATGRAQEVFLAGARQRGFALRRLGSPSAEDFRSEDVPMPVRQAIGAEPDAFLSDQPSLVLAMGEPGPPERRLVINFHVDTVGPHVPPTLIGDVLHGRGAVDDKGPGVAAAVGVAAAFADHPELAGQIEVLLTSVPGEEGGAMGVFGTRWLVAEGFTGRLMLFAEPTGGRVLDACTAAMTARLRVTGEDSTDDHPGEGHNATVALGFLADHLMRTVGPRAASLGAKFCVAGLHTGRSHNRVYGAGELLINIAYPDQATAELLVDEMKRAVDAAGDRFATAHAGNPFTARLVADWDRVVRLDWLKRGLPVLNNRDPEMEGLLAAAGFPRHDGLADGTAFTCDAIWAGGPGRYVAVCGPGRLDSNGAHTPTEHVRVRDLANYAGQIRDLVVRFGAHVATASGEK